MKYVKKNDAKKESSYFKIRLAYGLKYWKDNVIYVDSS